MRLIPLLIVLTFLPEPTGAAERCVSPSGDDRGGDGSGERPWKSIAVAIKGAAAGDTIRLSAGTHEWDGAVALPSGVNLIGAGKDKTLVHCNYAFDFEATKRPKGAAWLPGPFDYDPSAEKSAILRVNGENQTVAGFTMEGRNKKCVVGILVPFGKRLTFDDLGFTHFKISGLWLHETYDVEIKNCKFVDNSWGNANQAFGALQFNRADRLSIHDNDISERGSGCYGIKMAAMRVGAGMFSDNGKWREHTLNDDVRIYNNRIDVDETGTWTTTDGKGHPPAIAIEFNSDIEAKNVDIHHNWLNNQVSIVSWELGQATGYHVHHNVFDLRSDDKKSERYAYMLEANDSNFEVDHNLVFGGYYPIATWQYDKALNRNHRVHHNVFYGQAGNDVGAELPIFRDSSGHDGYEFYNNTVIDTRGRKNVFTVDNPNRRNANAEFRNNIFYAVAAGSVLGNDNAVGGAVVDHNLFYNLPPLGTGAVTGDPLLDIAGMRFVPAHGSPAIRAGVAITGVTDDAVGPPDLGAFESGKIPWKAGIQPPPAKPTTGNSNSPPESAPGAAARGSVAGPRASAPRG